MASMWRRAMLYLGLGPDDEYERVRRARLRRPRARDYRSPWHVQPAAGSRCHFVGHGAHDDPRDDRTSLR